MITTCDKCKWGKYSPCTTPGDKYEGQIFYYCEVTRNLIREASALDIEETCPNFLPKGASCDNCTKTKCSAKGKYKAGVCGEWEMSA
jgi:hypothetical protein